MTMDVNEHERQPHERIPYDEAWRRATAGFLFHAQLADRRLPEHLADIPDHLLVDRLARMDAKELLETLKEIYEVRWWDRESFERAFVHGALAGWRPGSLIQHKPNGLRVVSTTCPIAADVENDPRLCQSCQRMQKHAAYIALVGQVEAVEMDRTMSRGESACELNIRFRAQRPPTPPV